MSETGELATADMEETEVLNNVLPQALPVSTLAMLPGSLHPKARTGRMKNHPPQEKIRFETIEGT